MESFIRNTENNRYANFRVYLVSLLLIMFLLRLALPQYAKFVLFPLTLLGGVFAFYEFVMTIRKGNLEFNFLTLLPLILTALFYLFAFVLTLAKQNMLVSDFVNVLAVFAFSFIILFLLKNESELKASLSIFKSSAVIASSVIALLGLVKLYFQLIGKEFDFLKVETLGYPDGSSLSIDCNFFTLLCAFGIILTIPSIFRKISMTRLILNQIALLILLANMFLSTSRRGVIFAFLVLTTSTILLILSFIIKNEKLKIFRKNIIGFNIVSLSLFAVLVYLLFIVPPLERNKYVSLSGFDKSNVHAFVNNMILSVKSIFKGETDYATINSRIWETNFDSRYPYSGWATGNYTTVSEFLEENAEILPEEILGARIDKNIESSSWGGNAYYYSKLFDVVTTQRKRYVASVYCYVSPDFNGDWIRISSHNKVKGLTATYYDMDRKGVWQKLVSSFTSDSGSFISYLYVSKSNSNTFVNLKGHIIFAYPELNEITFDPKKPLTWAGVQYDEITQLSGRNADIVPAGTSGLRPNKYAFSVRDSLIYSSANVMTLGQNSRMERSLVTLYAYVSDDFNGDEVYLTTSGKYKGLGQAFYNMSGKGSWQKLTVSVNAEDNNVEVLTRIKKRKLSDADTLNGYTIFAYPERINITFNPGNPLTWAARPYIPLSKITGKNSEIVPNTATGYLINNSSTFITSRSGGNDYFSSKLEKMKIEKNFRCISSVYCFVSDNFNGEQVRLSVNGNIYGPKTDYYDLKQKGTWQKLITNNYGDSGYMEPYLFFSIPGNHQSKWLKGYVVYAYPEYKTIEFSPSNPESYSQVVFTREFPLQGKNSSIVPPGAAGYRIDNKTGGKILNRVCHSTTEFSSVPVAAGDSVYASAFCYVSEDFDGNEVSLRLRGNLIKNIITKYELETRGEWIKLETGGKAVKDGRTGGILYVSKKDVPDFTKMKGYVTFAYPVIGVVKHSDIIASRDSKKQYEPKTIVSKASLFSFFQKSNDTLTIESDSLKSLQDFNVEMANNKFIGPRYDRWRYALFLFKSEYSTWQKIFGGGFAYTKKFASIFHYREGTDYDYPHNPLFSVLLYSGILGLILYIWFILKAVQYYWLYRKNYWTIGICFLIGLYYAFFSSNNPFEPAIVGILNILPYIIHYNHIKSS